MSERRDEITKVLDEAGISYHIVEHPPALTTAEADSYIAGYEGVCTKSLFVVNRKRTQAYLVVMDDAKPLDLVALAQALEDTRLSLGSAERLWDALGLEPGVVSPFGMLDPAHRDLRLIFDRDMLAEPTLTFHPNDNTATIFLATDDLLTILRQHGVEYEVREL